LTSGRLLQRLLGFAVIFRQAKAPAGNRAGLRRSRTSHCRRADLADRIISGFAAHDFHVEPGVL
jgi:hypothetical protein